MCERSPSESGKSCGFTPCEQCIALLSEKSRLDGRCKGLEEGADITKRMLANETELLQDALARLEKAEAENAALRQERYALNDAVMQREGECVTLIRQVDQLCQERARLDGIVKMADALAEAIQHATDLREVAGFLRARIEELRELIRKPWEVQFDDFRVAVKEMANRSLAFDELYDYTEYINRVKMVENAAKAYQEDRHG
jgi:chromosome segregation ATPase